MFKINDVVFFEDFGLCHILDIEERTFNNELKLYYVLKPISDCASLSNKFIKRKSITVNCIALL